jgi:endogenous inhibitor of DNA gyrase (YacG/DUF329 family)
MVSTLSCPTCGRPVAVEAEARPAAFPFCSSRCRLRDCGKWLDGTHAIPGSSLSIGDPYDGEPGENMPGPEGAWR